MKQKSPAMKAIVNRRARFDYQLDDELVVGVALSGPEVRAIRDNRAQLRGAYVTIRDDELWLNNASLTIAHTAKGQGNELTVDTNPRKLLAHRKQITALAAEKKAGMTIVPLRLLNGGRHIKLVIALGKGKKTYDKRETIKRRDQEREARRQLKH